MELGAKSMEFASCAMGSCVAITVGNNANNTRMKKLSIAINTVMVHMYDFNVLRTVFSISVNTYFQSSSYNLGSAFLYKISTSRFMKREIIIITVTMV